MMMSVMTSMTPSSMMMSVLVPPSLLGLDELGLITLLGLLLDTVFFLII